MTCWARWLLGLAIAFAGIGSACAADDAPRLDPELDAESTGKWYNGNHDGNRLDL